MKTPLTDLGSPAILVIDMQRDFVDAGAPIECPGARAIIPDIARLLDVARERQLPIIYTEERHRHDGIDLEIANSEPPHCLEGTSGIELVPLLRPRPADYIVAKRRYSGFFATDLDLLLRSLRVDTLILAGAATDVCVRATAQDAHQLNYRVIVAREWVAGTSDDQHQAALHNIDYVFGYVTSARVVLGLLEQTSATVHTEI
ncbi:MAG: cysteine hydrolase family protein [Geodermatophilaceae bacterium]